MLAFGTPDSTIGESRVLTSGILKLAAAALTIASAIGLTGMGAQAAEVTAVPHAKQAATLAAGPYRYNAVTVMLTTVSPDFTCPDRTLCLFQDTGLTGLVREFPMPDSGDIWFAIREGNFTVPWGSLNDKTGSRVVFRDAQTGMEFCENAGYRGTPPNTSGERSTGYLYIQYGVPDC